MALLERACGRTGVATPLCIGVQLWVFPTRDDGGGGVGEEGTEYDNN